MSDTLIENSLRFGIHFISTGIGSCERDGDTVPSLYNANGCCYLVSHNLMRILDNDLPLGTFIMHKLPGFHTGH